MEEEVEGEGVKGRERGRREKEVEGERGGGEGGRRKEEEMGMEVRGV